MQRRRRTHWVITSGVTLTALLAAAAPAPAALTGPGVQAGHNITVFHNIDFIAVFGYPVGDPITIDIVRDGHRVASATGPAVDTPEGGGLEVNHGPEGTPAPGDCWTNWTPDVRPGDRVIVRHGASVEEVTVDDIFIDQGPTILAATGPSGPPENTVELRGIARNAVTGVAIPAESLDSGEVRNPSTRVRATPDEVIADPDPTRPGGWIMRYIPPYNGVFLNESGQTGDTLRDSIVAGDHAIGFGHVVPLPLHSMLVDGVDDVHGPALGCEAAPAAVDGVGTSSVGAVNVTALAAAPNAGDDVVVLGGAAGPDVTNVDVTLSDGTITINAASVRLTPAVPGGHQGWSANFRRDDVLTLADGTLTASMTATRTAATPGASMTLLKDTVAPAVTPDPAAGSYVGPTQVSLLGAAPGDLVTYRVDGTPAGPQDTRYDSRGLTLQPGTRTLTTYVEDAAGNVSRGSHLYEIAAPPVQQDGTADTGAGGAATGGAPAGSVVPPAGSAFAPFLGSSLANVGVLRISRLSVPKRLTRRQARRGGIPMKLTLMEGTRGLRIVVLRRRPGRPSVVIARLTRTTTSSGPLSVTLRNVGLRRKLGPGRYIVRVTPRRGTGAEGQSSSAQLVVGR